ncbi:MAG: sigma-70 family RNA polymerase sigma factor [Planctomycetia bacterium]|nr:sigma-70 family RNA polymerase sigma factor [Planctomycetia bacterium]
MTDGELVRQALDGGATAFEELVRRWAGRVLAVCHAHVRSSHLAEDLAQESLMRAYRALGTLAEPEKFGSWLRGIAVRACLDWIKSRPASVVPFAALGEAMRAEDLADEQLGPDAGLEHEDEVQRLLAAVEALPVELGEVVMLYYYNDLTYHDLAQLLGIAPATVNARLTRARALLRSRLSKRSN